jgi:hypothetical protein
MEAHARTTVERLARNISRPAVSVERLARTAQGDVRYRLKTPYRGRATHFLLEPLDLLAGVRLGCGVARRDYACGRN